MTPIPLSPRSRARRPATDPRATPGIRHRPPLPGGYVGLGSQVWAWLALHRLGAGGSDALSRARALARLLPDAVAASEEAELLAGAAGAIIPLLHLAAVTSENQWLDQATAIGDRLIETARWENDTACWPSPRWPRGLGGLCHGVTGIGWSLARLALATGQPRFSGLAMAAFAFEDTLYDPDAGGWHGAVTGYASTTPFPGLLAGTSGIAYQLLRMHPECDLPSVLTLQP
ncbi:MAG TPA: lanthionine synthetase LanC family protein [Streptosporangiaceae bacterium]